MAKNEEGYHKIIARRLELLGAGVSGHVFVVDDHNVVKEVALKTCNAYMDNESVMRAKIHNRSWACSTETKAMPKGTTGRLPEAQHAAVV